MLKDLRRHIMMQSGGAKIIEAICLRDGAYIDFPIPLTDYNSCAVEYHLYREAGFIAGNRGGLFVAYKNGVRQGVLSFIGAFSGYVQFAGYYLPSPFKIFEGIRGAGKSDLKVRYTINGNDFKAMGGSARFYYDGVEYGANLINGSGSVPTIFDSLRILGFANYTDVYFVGARLGNYIIRPAEYNGEYGVVCNGMFYGNSAGVGYITGE